MDQFVVSTIVLVCLYALLGAGFVVVYRCSRVLNFAHGEFMMLGGYFALALATAGASTWSAIAVALVGICIVGFLIYHLTMRPMVGQPIHSVVLVTIGLSIVLRGIATLLWGGDFRYLTQVFHIANPPVSIVPGSITLSVFDIAIVVVSVLFLSGLLLFLSRVRLGVQMKVAAENPLLASQRGINVYALFALSWTIAVFSAAVGGILYGLNSYISPEMGIVGLMAAPVAIVGGMDSVKGVIPGAVVVALVQNATMRYVDPIVGVAAPMVVLLLVLIVRPWGLFGTEEELERV